MKKKEKQLLKISLRLTTISKNLFEKAKEYLAKKKKIIPQKIPVLRMIQEQRYLELITKNPRNIDAYLRLGILYKERGSKEDSTACFAQVLKLDPENRKAREELQVLKR